ncbi:BlaI/MecI/CopY family transcriptional regulator [Mycolicibacterium sp. HS_4_1]
MRHEDLSVIDVCVVTTAIPEVLTYFRSPRRSQPVQELQLARDPNPRLPKKLRPKSITVWVAAVVACSDAFAMATGSPGAPALARIGSNGSQLSPLACADIGTANASDTNPATTLVRRANCPALITVVLPQRHNYALNTYVSAPHITRDARVTIITGITSVTSGVSPREERVTGLAFTVSVEAVDAVDRTVVRNERRGQRVRIRGFGELEAVIMDRVWCRAEPATVRNIFDELSVDRPIAYTTVLSTMDNLHKKGWLTRERVGKAFEYRPVLTREEHTAQLMHAAFDDGGDAELVLAFFLHTLDRNQSARVRAALRRIIDGTGR